MVILILVAAFAPICAAMGMVLWRRFIERDEAATGLVTTVAIGLAGGAVLGCLIAAMALGLVLALSHTMTR